MKGKRGLIILLVTTVLMLALMAGAAYLTGGLSAGRTPSQTGGNAQRGAQQERQSYPIRVTDIDIETVSCGIQVVRGEVSQIEVQLDLSAADAQSSQLVATQRGQSLRIEQTFFEHDWWDWSSWGRVFDGSGDGQSQVVVTVPREWKGKTVEVSTTSGGIGVDLGSGLDKVALEATSGSISGVVEHTAMLEVDAVSGSTDLQGGFDEARVDTVSGSVDFAIRGAVRELKVDMVSGSLRVDTDQSEVDVFFDTVSGSLDIDPALTQSSRAGLNLKANSVSGSVEINPLP